MFQLEVEFGIMVTSNVDVVWDILIPKLLAN
jgi:hypothetical protein